MHHEFITKTDKKSLFNRIKYLVDCGKESYNQDRKIRTNNIRNLIENEDKAFEDEFTEKIKQRVELDINARKNYLIKNREEREEEVKMFVASSKVHQRFLNCLEIRDELLRKDNHQTQVIHLFQMDEKLRAQNRQKKEDEFWLKVQNRVNERVDITQEQEDCLKKSLNSNQRRCLDMQVREHEKEKEMDAAHIKKEMAEVRSLAKEIDDKDNKAGIEVIKAKTREAKLALMHVREQQQLFKDEAQNYEDVFHSEVMKQVNKEIEEAKLKDMRLKQETRNYLEYLKKYHEFVAEDEKNRNAIEDEGNQRYNCMKHAPRKRLIAGKRQLVEISHQMLLKQICEDQAKKMRLEDAEKEKMPDYPFPKVKIVDKLKERLKRQKELADQIEVINRLKEMKEKEFENVLNRAEEDKKFCAQVLELHKGTGIDYLPTHPNWMLLRCDDCLPGKGSPEDKTKQTIEARCEG